MMLDTRRFGRTGLEVTPIGFGGAPIGFLETEQGQIEQILNLLLDSGVNLIDTAARYAGSEEAIGKGVSHRRHEFVLVSKCGDSFPDIPGDDWSKKVILQTVDRALRRLKTDHIDVMLLHSCDLDVLERGEAIEALVQSREAGKIRFAGYSGDNEAAAYAAGLDDIAVIETSINLCDQDNIDAVLPIARRHGCGVIAKRPIANAAWKDLNEQPGFYSEYAKEYTERLARMDIDFRDLDFDGEGWLELALRFTLSQEGVHAAIIGTTNPEHVRMNLEIAAKGPLNPELVNAVRKRFRDAQRHDSSSWRGLR